MTPIGTEPRKSLRLLKLFGAAVLFSLFLGTVAAFFFLDAIALLIAKPLLAPYGVQLLHIEGLLLHRDQVALESLSFRLDGADENSQINKLDIRFSNSGLLALPVQRLYAESVGISLATSANDETASNTFTLPRLPRISELLDTLQAIPGNAFEIGRLDVAPYIEAGRLSVDRDDRELRIKISAQDSSADVRVNWHDSQYVSSHLLPEQALSDASPSSEVLTGRMLIGALGAEMLSTDFTLSEQQQRLQLDARSLLQLDAVSAFAQQTSPLPDPLLSLAGQFDVTWRLSEPENNDSTQTIPFSAFIAANSAADSTLQSESPSGLNSLRWRNVDTVSVLGDYSLATQALDIRITAPAMRVLLGVGQAPPAQLSVDLDELHVNCADSLNCRISHSSTLRLPALTWLDSGVQDLLLVSNGTIALEPDHFDLHFAQGSRLEIGTLHTQNLDLKELNTVVQQAFDLSIAEDGGVQLDSGGVDLYLPSIIVEGKNSQFAGTVSELSGRLSETETQLQAHVQLRNIGSEWLPFILRKPEVEFDFSVSTEELSAMGFFRVADRELVQFDGIMDTTAFTAQANIKTPILEFASDSQSLSQWFYQAPFEADIISGSLQSSAELALRRDENETWLISGPISMEAVKISGFYQDTALIELSTALSGTLQDSTTFVSAGLRPFSLASIDPGLPVENISLQYGIDTRATRVNIQDLEAWLFGGRVHSTGLVFDWSAASNSVIVDVERIDISRLLSLAAYDSIKATGLVSGTIPITLTGTTPSVDTGRLRVEAPGGAINYSPEGGVNSGNAALDLVNQALSNYQYNLMETEVEYLPTGELELGVKLQGHNPDLNDGQRINLNLNISDNIPALLRSLQAGRSITEAFERQLQAP